MMMSISGACTRLVVDIVQAFGIVRSSPTRCLDPNPIMTCKEEEEQDRPDANQLDDFMVRALTSVFGMENNGKINKEKARWVVEQLGLLYTEEEEDEEQQQQQQKDEPNIVDVPAGGAVDDGVPVEEVLSGLEECSDRHELLREAFKIFDEDGNGYIDAMELKRVLQCLGLDKGWDMKEIERMLKAADLNLDGKVDFSEFELMMG